MYVQGIEIYIRQAGIHCSKKRERRECVSMCVRACVFERQKEREGKVFFVLIRASVVYLTRVTSSVTITEDKNELKSNHTG